MIKWIAMLLMVVDHLGYYLGFLMPRPIELTLRLIGRLSFPIFAYLCAVGFLRTRNRMQYFLRMLIFACLTQAALQFTSYITGIPAFTNVMFTFSISILFMASSEILELAVHGLRSRSLKIRSGDPGVRHGRVLVLGRSIPDPVAAGSAVFSMILILAVTEYWDPDYNLFGVLTVYLFYIVLKKFRKPGILLLADDRAALQYMTLGFLGLNIVWAFIGIFIFKTPAYWSIMEIFSVCSIGILLMDVPRKKPSVKEKYFFYLFYPLHLAMLMVLRYFLLN